ncbi:MAG TPA: hypothetical protein VIQ30_24705, partial [Pseudonocardia sp.]
ANDDLPLLNHASWRTRVGSTPVMRWPLIRVNLARSPELIDAVLSARVQSRLAVDNPPTQAVGDDIDVLVEGYAETIGHKEWLVGFNTSPAAVWDVATVDGEQRPAADGSTLAADLTAGGTSMLLLSTPENGPWTEDPSEMPLDMRVGGERVTATAIGPTLSDAFGRTVASGWGSADTGQAWTTSPSGDHSTGSGVGQQSIGSVNAFRTATIDVGSPDHEYTVDLSLNISSAAGAGGTFWFCARLTDLSNYYVARLDLGTGGTMVLGWYKRVGGTLTTITSPVSAGSNSSGNWWRIRVRAIGSGLYATAQNISTGTAMISVSGTDSSLTTGNNVGILSRLEAGNTNPLPVLAKYDTLLIDNPQTVTLSARGVNGVNRAWSAGAEVDAWYPAIVGL